MLAQTKLDAAGFCRLDWDERRAPETLPTGISGLDLPRGCITEFTGPASSGRTTAMFAALAEAAARQEFCALVDTDDAFDPVSAAGAGVALDSLLCVRCGGDAEHTLKATDLLVQGGGFGLVVMDLGDTPPQTARRISLTSWFRLRRAIEHTPTILLVVEREPNAKTCATLSLEFHRSSESWSGEPGCSRLWRGARFEVARRKPVRSETAAFQARAYLKA